MVGGIVIGVSGLRWVDPHAPVIHVFAELGVILLLFLIGLETDIARLLSVGGNSFAVAVVGVALPFAGGWAAGLALGYPTIVSVFLGAALTATSVGITARVFSDLGAMKSDEAQVVLGAAVVDDILGLILLTVVGALAAGQSVTTLAVVKIAATAFGFVIAAIAIGSLLAPRLLSVVGRLRVTRAVFFASITFAFALASLAEAVGSALIIGAFAAGLVLARTDRGKDIERQVYDVAQFFIPIFFVAVGAAVDLRSLNPFDPQTRPFLLVGLLLTVIGVAGKLAAGFVVFGRPLRRIVIGVGMIPRGEVGLIFANLGLSAGLLSTGLYSSVALMVMATTFVTPPVLRALVKRGDRPRDEQRSVVSDLVSDAMPDGDERVSS
jgi:Kef-type K+ transport system membrane component KefB